MKPSGVQLARPIRPPSRTTRSISRAARVWSGENITPKVESTTSKLEFAKGNASASATSKRDVQSFGLGTCLSLFKQGSNVVGGRDLGKATRRGQGCIAVSRSDVEYALSRTHIDRLGERLANDLQCRADNGEIATRPRGLLPGLDGGKVGSC